MRLVASMIIDEQVEQGRYLDVCIDHLREFCDDIVIARDHVDVDFFAHEGRARQRLLEMTLATNPTHVLALDADEFVTEGRWLRTLIEAAPSQPAWWLDMLEVWEIDGDCLCVRVDGGWRPHPVPACWRVPDRIDNRFRIADRPLACGRVPVPVDEGSRYAPDGVSILHLGWTNPAERQQRFDRYVVHDGGRYHANTHLQSILWPVDRVDLEGVQWPAPLAPFRARISDQAGIVAA